MLSFLTWHSLGHLVRGRDFCSWSDGDLGKNCIWEDEERACGLPFL